MGERDEGSEKENSRGKACIRIFSVQKHAITKVPFSLKSALFTILNHALLYSWGKKNNRQVQGAPQSQTEANPRHQEEEKKDKNIHAQNKQTNVREAQRLAPSSSSEVIRMVKQTGRGSSIGSVFAWHASGPEFDPHVRHILSWRLGHENISTAILPLPLIQEEQLSVTGERMCTKYW